LTESCVTCRALATAHLGRTRRFGGPGALATLSTYTGVLPYCGCSSVALLVAFTECFGLEVFVNLKYSGCFQFYVLVSVCFSSE